MGGFEARALALVEPKCEIPPLLLLCPNQYRKLRGRLTRQYVSTIGVVTYVRSLMTIHVQKYFRVVARLLKVACPKQKQRLVLLDKPSAQLPVLEQCLVGSLTGAVAS